MTIITLFKSQDYLAEHECSTNWGDYKANQMLVFEETGKLECPGKTPGSKQTQPMQIWRRIRESISGHIGMEGECSHHCAAPLLFFFRKRYFYSVCKTAS